VKIAAAVDTLQPLRHGGPVYSNWFLLRTHLSPKAGEKVGHPANEWGTRQGCALHGTLFVSIEI